MTVADLARAGFALGYARTANDAAMSHRTMATCAAIQESADQLIEFPGASDLILEAGRTEGHRDRREAQHSALYTFHSAKLAAALTPILARLDTAEIARQAVEHASAQAQAGADPVSRRRAVVTLVLGALTAQVHADDRTTLDELNADGWAHATAQGQAEAHATPAKGGPPDTAIVHGLALTGLAALTRNGTTDAAATWTDEQLRSLAMGVALASGDGAAVGEATRKATAALVDTDRATAAYANQLHQAVNAAYIQRIAAQSPEAQFNWVTAADPCDDCTANQLESPYDWADIPECPGHPNCVPGSTRVTVPGTTWASTDRKYVGDVVTIVLANGYQLTATPNHPVATQRGWVPIAKLALGDDVLCSTAPEWGPDEDDVPPSIEQVAKSLSVGLPSVPTAAEDFHGDGAGSDVHVVRTHGLLQSDLEALTAKQLGELVLGRGCVELASLTGDCASLQLGDGSDSTTSSNIGGGHVRGPFGLGHPVVSHGLSLAHAATGHAHFGQPTTKRQPADAKGFCEGLLALSGDITTSQLVGISRDPFGDHVFNLQTSDGWYVANGIVTHNCQCNVEQAATVPALVNA